MGQYLLALAAALVVGAVIFGITVLVTGSDQGLGRVEPDGRAIPLPGTRPLLEHDVDDVRFDVTWRGYRMAQVDAALRRAAYDIGYKDELIGVLEAEVAALREGRMSDAEVLRRAREAALVPAAAEPSADGTPDAEGASDGSEAAEPTDPPPGDPQPGDPAPDGSVPDGSVPDGSAPGGSVPDGSAVPVDNADRAGAQGHFDTSASRSERA
jgi:DivIVA domain-containing protein